MFIIEQSVDLRRENAPKVYGQPLEYGDKNAHEWRVTIADGGAKASLEGAAALFTLRRAAGPAEIEQDPTVRVVTTEYAAKVDAENGVVSAVFNASCYGGVGNAVATMCVTMGETTVTMAVLILQIGRSRSDVLIDPEHMIPSLQELLGLIGEMEDAKGEVEKWAKAEVQAETLSPGSEATAYAEESAEGRVTIKYGIPAGVAGAEYIQIPFTALADAWVGRIDGTYVQEIGVPDMPDAPGELHLDASQIDSANAAAMLDDMAMIWKAETYSGGVRLEALGWPNVDLPLLAGVYKWVI